METRRTKEQAYDVVVIGCGFAGIGMGIELLRQGVTSFCILESERDLGGTWRDNTYPGVAVDIPSFTYSFSYAQKPDWSRLFAPGRELKTYADDCVARYGLRKHIQFEARVESATFSAEPTHWRLVLHDGSTITARTVISATGLLTQPKLPALPGLDSFRGELLHTARWRDDVAIAGQRVAVIGTGATTVQLVPALAPRTARLTVFQRTPIWVLPKLDAALPLAAQALFRRLPAVQQLLRAGTTVGTELVMVLAIVYHRQFPLLVRAIEQTCRFHLQQQVRDPAVRAALTPHYGFGCKRPTFSNDYLKSFNEPHVQLQTRSIREVLAHAIVTDDGREYPVDTLICATGFQTYERGNLPTYSVHGRGGRELGAFWAEHRYQAYHGTSVPDFPNFFLMVGPYAATGSSWFAMIENQARHITRCLQHAQKTQTTLIEVKQSAHDRFFADTQLRQRNTVFFNNGCASANSYYFDKHGDAVFYKPASGLEAYLHSLYFPLSDYQFA